MYYFFRYYLQSYYVQRKNISFFSFHQMNSIYIHVVDIFKMCISRAFIIVFNNVPIEFQFIFCKRFFRR
jgi:hypothetical protein